MCVLPLANKKKKAGANGEDIKTTFYSLTKFIALLVLFIGAAPHACS